MEMKNKGITSATLTVIRDPQPVKEKDKPEESKVTDEKTKREE